MEMRKFNISIILLALLSIAAAPSRTYNYVAHATIDPAQNNTNENSLYTYLQAGVDTYAPGSITNAAISSSAAIAYSKLNLIGSIVNADISPTAGIVGSKLDLTSPGAIGSVAPNTGGFTTLSATTIKTTGNVGIGTTSTAGGRLIVRGGNVGIGTTIANVELDISGQVRPSAGILFGDATTQTTAAKTLSNMIFQYNGIDVLTNSASASAQGETVNAALNPASPTVNYRFLVQGTNVLTTVLNQKWIKVQGVNTWTVYVKAAVNNGGDTGEYLMSVGAQTGNATTASTSPTWITFTVDVSSLTNGNAYDVLFQMANNSTNGREIYAYQVIAFGS